MMSSLRDGRDQRFGPRLYVVACCLLALLPAACSSAKRDAEAAVKQRLTDPDSAQFQAVVEKGDYVCGEVNSKNKAGGYDGFRRFYVAERGKGAVLIDPRAWASADAIRMFGGLVGPHNDTTAFEAEFDRVCA